MSEPTPVYAHSGAGGRHVVVGHLVANDSGMMTIYLDLLPRDGRLFIYRPDVEAVMLREDTTLKPHRTG